jgi:hypothetical protein
VKMIQEYYRQMRKFGCNILAVVQQYDIIKDSPVRGATIGNSKMLLKLKSTGHFQTNFGGRFGSCVWKVRWLEAERFEFRVPRWVTEEMMATDVYTALALAF